MTQISSPGNASRNGSEAPARGRPPKVTAAELERVALTLWDERGYDAVPLADVAAAAGVTIRTVFRYFRSKSDIVWNGLGADFGDIRANLDATSPDQSLLSRIRAAVTRSIAVGTSNPVDRLRLRIIGRTPELQHSGPEPFRAWHAIVRDWVAEQLGAAPGDVEPQVIASAAQSAILSALLWWSMHGSTSPQEVVDRALRRLESVCAPMDG